MVSWPAERRGAAPDDPLGQPARPTRRQRWTRALAAMSLSCAGLITAQAQPAASPQGCRPDVLRQPTLRGLWVAGELSGFDPCHASVQWRVPRSTALAPVVMTVHGGGGRADAQAITDAFHAAGYATLTFDAYEMNGLARNPRLSNASRQAMLFKVGREALLWLRERQDVDARRLFLYGISNGASVVLNLAALSGIDELQAVLSEAPTPVGMGYPAVVRAPVRILFGEDDDLGAPVGKRRWDIAEPCRFNLRVPEAPAGTADQCGQHAPGGTMLTTTAWMAQVRSQGRGVLSLQRFPGVAHGAFLGPLKTQTWADFMRSRGARPEPFMEGVGWSEGATDEGRQALWSDALRFLAQHGGLPVASHPR